MALAADDAVEDDHLSYAIDHIRDGCRWVDFNNDFLGFSGLKKPLYV